MRIGKVLLALPVSVLATSQWFPLDTKGNIPTDITPYEVGQDIPIDCTARRIDTGEHKFEGDDKIVYTPFPTCKETGKPLTFKYGVNEDINCTIGFTDELYHLFQLYIHQDVPFSCRLPFSSSIHYIESGGAQIPLTFNFRGEVHDSHLDIDPAMNVVFIKPSNNNKKENTVLSAIAWSSSTNTTRIVVGNYMTVSFAVRWYDQLVNAGSLADKYENNGLPYSDGFYKLPMNVIAMSKSSMYLLMTFIALGAGFIVFVFTQRSVSAKYSKAKYNFLDNESTGSAKVD